MSAQILDGKALAAEIRSEVKTQVAALAEKGVSTALAVILVGDDSASQVYVRNKIKACADTGIRSLEFRMPAETTQQQLLAKIAELNADENVDGILVQLPLPKQINADAVISAIDPAKDVDGFHVANAGALVTGKQGFVPCTPFGVMRLIENRASIPAANPPSSSDAATSWANPWPCCFWLPMPPSLSRTAAHPICAPSHATPTFWWPP